MQKGHKLRSSPKRLKTKKNATRKGQELRNNTTQEGQEFKNNAKRPRIDEHNIKGSRVKEQCNAKRSKVEK